MDPSRTEMSTRCLCANKEFLINWKTENDTLSQQFHNLIAKLQLEAISIPLTQKYMTSQLSGSYVCIVKTTFNWRSWKLIIYFGNLPF
jgi:hypothetical protein